jgi:hypothetical protein
MRLKKYESTWLILQGILWRLVLAKTTKFSEMNNTKICTFATKQEFNILKGMASRIK